MIHAARPGWQWGDPSGASRPAPRRPVYGRVYELFTARPDLDGDHPYVGQTVQTIAARKCGHKSARSVARDPWKARIVDGPRGHRLLETVYATGDARHDQAILDQVEAFWIDRLRTTHNGPRPVRPRPGDPLPARPRGARPSPRPRVARPRRPFPWRAALFLLLATATALLAGRLVSAMHLPWPWAAYAAALAAGVPLGWRMTTAVLRGGRRLRVWR